MQSCKSPPIATHAEFESSAKDLVGGDALSLLLSSWHSRTGRRTAVTIWPSTKSLRAAPNSFTAAAGNTGVDTSTLFSAAPFGLLAPFSLCSGRARAARKRGWRALFAAMLGNVLGNHLHLIRSFVSKINLLPTVSRGRPVRQMTPKNPLFYWFSAAEAVSYPSFYPYFDVWPRSIGPGGFHGSGTSQGSARRAHPSRRRPVGAGPGLAAAGRLKARPQGPKGGS
jgi:hypothetical protein